MKDRRRGALIGLAVGDALGAAVEFRPPGNFTPVTGYRSGGPHRLAAGEWTDDTSMALALADSIATVCWDLNDQAERYVQWRDTGKYSVNGRCFDIGISRNRFGKSSIAMSNIVVPFPAWMPRSRSTVMTPTITSRTAFLLSAELSGNGSLRM